MSEVQAAKARPDLIRWAMVVLALVGAAAVLYVIGAASFKPKQESSLRDLARGGLEKLEVAAAPTPVPQVPFTDETGKTVTLGDFRGQVVVLNLWATWCAPCKVEMPTLARLQAAYAVQPVRVIALSIDKDADLQKVRDQLALTPPLKLYRDKAIRMPFALQPKAEGFPTTIIIDRRGRERARLSGGADWSSPEARELVERLLHEG